MLCEFTKNSISNTNRGDLCNKFDVFFNEFPSTCVNIPFIAPSITNSLYYHQLPSNRSYREVQSPILLTIAAIARSQLANNSSKYSISDNLRTYFKTRDPINSIVQYSVIRSICQQSKVFLLCLNGITDLYYTSVMSKYRYKLVQSAKSWLHVFTGTRLSYVIAHLAEMKGDNTWIHYVTIFNAFLV